MTWLKNSESLDPKQVSVRNSETDSILFIRRTERKDSGVYELQVQIENVEDKASVTIQIVGKSSVSPLRFTFLLLSYSS